MLVIARKKEVSFELLHHYNIPFISRGQGSRSFFGKLTYLAYAAFIIFRSGLRFKPTLIIGFASPYAALASFFLRCKCIILDDTEVGRFERFIYKPISDLIITPKAFKKELGKKHFRFDGFIELSYLLPAYFHPDQTVMDDLGLKANEKFIIIRFVSWEASHDKGEKGLSYQQKHEITDICSKYARIFISSENQLPDSLEKFRIKIKPCQLHDALYYASLYVGEGATTASESCLVGTPAVYINSITAGTIEEQERFGVLFNFRDFNGVKEQISKILDEKGKERYISLSQAAVCKKIDVTAFLTWLIEEYPGSRDILMKDPGYQFKFVQKQRA